MKKTNHVEFVVWEGKTQDWYVAKQFPTEDSVVFIDIVGGKMAFTSTDTDHSVKDFVMGWVNDFNSIHEARVNRYKLSFMFTLASLGFTIIALWFSILNHLI